MTKRLICKNCGADNHFGNLNCKECEEHLDEGDIDSDREMLRERDMERLQASAETGGDY